MAGIVTPVSDLRIDLPGLTLKEATWEAVAVNVLLRPAGGLGNGCCEKSCKTKGDVIALLADGEKPGEPS